MPSPFAPFQFGGIFSPFRLIPSGAGDEALQVTNAQKLSLDPATAVGTQVTVTDWETAGLSGPNQTLAAPSSLQGGVAVLGGTQDGVWRNNGHIANDKPVFQLLGDSGSGEFDGGDSILIYWSNGDRWKFRIVDVDLYYSLSDVATPDLASNWLNASDDTPAAITVASVTQGDLVAGALQGGENIYVVDGNQNGYPAYTKISGGSTSLHVHLVPGESSVWRDQDDVNLGDANGPFLWPNNAERNDVASEANWVNS